MSDETWKTLEERPFGDILFPQRGPALPESIANGDLDGDLYYICWDKEIVKTVHPQPCGNRKEEDEVEVKCSLYHYQERKAGSVQPRQGTEICNFGEISPLDFLNLLQ